jgi:hypothetical protein
VTQGPKPRAPLAVTASAALHERPIVAGYIWPIRASAGLASAACPAGP